MRRAARLLLRSAHVRAQRVGLTQDGGSPRQVPTGVRDEPEGEALFLFFLGVGGFRGRDRSLCDGTGPGIFDLVVFSLSFPQIKKAAVTVVAFLRIPSFTSSSSRGFLDESPPSRGNTSSTRKDDETKVTSADERLEERCAR